MKQALVAVLKKKSVIITARLTTFTLKIVYYALLDHKEEKTTLE